MPVFVGPSLTRADVEAWDITHLETAATHWRSAAQRWESHFETIHTGMLRPGGTRWEGPAADTAVERSWADVMKVRGAGDALYAAAGYATNGAGDIAWAKRQVLDAITEAEEAGFTVGQDFSVTDKSWGGLMRTTVARQQQAQAFATEISTRVQTLAAMDQQVATQITTALAPLETPQFGEPPNPSPPIDHGLVHAVDYQFKRDPSLPDPGQGDDHGGRHDRFDDRYSDGTWAHGNSGINGRGLEQQSLDELQKELQRPVLRDRIQVRGLNPVSGQVEGRYYDGLVPTDTPGEYLGVEHKTGSSRDQRQEDFDSGVSRQTPATGTLNGQPIKIVGVIDRWSPTPDSEHAPGGVAPPAGAAPGGTAPALPPPPVMRRDDGAPLVPGPGSNPFPNWGTHISPDELAKSDDPELSNLGKFYRGMFPHVDPSDPDNTA